MLLPKLANWNSIVRQTRQTRLPICKGLVKKIFEDSRGLSQPRVIFMVPVISPLVGHLSFWAPPSVDSGRAHRCLLEAGCYEARLHNIF